MSKQDPRDDLLKKHRPPVGLKLALKESVGERRRPRLDNLSAVDLDQIRRLIEETDIDAVSDDLGKLVETRWPWLLAKLPPRAPH